MHVYTYICKNEKNIDRPFDPTLRHHFPTPLGANPSSSFEYMWAQITTYMSPIKLCFILQLVFYPNILYISIYKKKIFPYKLQYRYQIEK